MTPLRFRTLLVPFLLVAGCWSTTERRPDPTDPGAAGAALDRLPLVELELPTDSRLGSPPPATVPLTAWEPEESTAGTTWRHPSPVRPRALRYLGKPRSLWVLDETGRSVPFGSTSSRRTWSMSAEGIAMHATRPDEPAPVGWAVESPVAQVREARLNLLPSGLDPDSFARASLQVGATTRRGLLLPAPGVAAVDLEVPPAAELHLAPGIVPPETRDLPASDGASLVIELDDRGRTRTLRTVALAEGVFAPVRVDLSRWAGRRVRLRFRTEPGGDPRFDYVLLGEPMVAPRKARPKRVVLVFVDTLRPDHLGLYGYERPTSPSLDAWAEGAAVFEDTRSVAPWTLPSYRAALTGGLPGRWRTATTLQDRLHDAGWATAMLAGNVYLSSNFDGDRGWGEHHVVNAPSATEQVDRALAWLATHAERDSLLLVHFMDPHVPYEEPETHRTLFAGPHPDALPETILRSTVRRHDDDPAVREYVTGRYDNNVRFVDDELARLLGALPPDDLVVVFSDHGEELWEHGGFEHGHTLYDEVVRVPMLVRGPGVTPGRFAGATSLLDLVPTVLDWLGEPAHDGPGVSLIDVAAGEIDAEALDARMLPLGDPLYGYQRWGVVHARQKYRTLKGREHLHDLVADPGEQVDLWADALGSDAATWRDHLARAQGGEPATVWRVAVDTVRTRGTFDGLELRVAAAGGIDSAWVAADRVGTGEAVASIEGDEAVIRWPESWRGRAEAYVRPRGALPEVRPAVRVRRGDEAWLAVPFPADRLAPDGNPSPLVDLDWPDDTRLVITHAAIPVLPDDVQPTGGYSPELESMLRAAGYAVGPQD